MLEMLKLCRETKRLMEKTTVTLDIGRFRSTRLNQFNRINGTNHFRIEGNR